MLQACAPAHSLNNLPIIGICVCLLRFLVRVDLEEKHQYSIHDQYDSFSMFLHKHEQPAFAELDRVVRQKGQMASMYDKRKLGLYMWCRRASDTTLRLQTNDVPEIHQMPYLF